MDVIAARSAVIGHFDFLAGFVRREDLQIGDDDRLVAIDRHVGQAGEMGEAAGDRGLVAGLALQVAPIAACFR